MQAVRKNLQTYWRVWRFCIKCFINISSIYRRLCLYMRIFLFPTIVLHIDSA